MSVKALLAAITIDILVDFAVVAVALTDVDFDVVVIADVSWKNLYCQQQQPQQQPQSKSKREFQLLQVDESKRRRSYLKSKKIVSIFKQKFVKSSALKKSYQKIVMHWSMQFYK